MPPASRTSHRGFTIVELLVVVAIIALLIGLLIPAITKAKDTGRVTVSTSNLRNLGTAHYTYTMNWNDRQFTLIDDRISTYGGALQQAFIRYELAQGEEHPPIWLGWSPSPDGGGPYHYILVSAGDGAYQPISFEGDSGSGGERFGSFRLLNVEAFHDYVNGKFYDPLFYAPKDDVALASVRHDFESPYSFVSQGFGNLEWATYCLSPAAMFHPQVLAAPDANGEGGFRDPWTLSGGFRAPSMSQVRYGSLKTHLLEHHWLQNQPKNICNPSIYPGTYDKCEPYYFNHGSRSAPATIFYDGHTELIGVSRAQRADGRIRGQTASGAGLWSRDTDWGEDGYFIDLGYDQAATSFHIFTTDGIKGRDVLSE